MQTRITSKTKSLLLIVALVVFTICSCSRSAPTNPILLRVDPNNPKFLEIDKYFNDVKYIPLETSDDCIIGTIKKFITVNGKIYLQTENHELLVFSESGLYIDKISSKGRGPGEYIGLEDFDVTDDGRIFIWDWSSRKMIVYDDQGRFQNSFSPELSFINFRVLASGKILAYCDRYNNHQIAIIDLSNNSHVFYLPWLPDQSGLKVMISERLNDRSSEYCFTLRGDNNIYAFINDSIVPIASVDFGSYQKDISGKTDEKTLIIIDDQVKGLTLSGKMGDLSTFLDFPRFAYLQYLTGVINTHAIWDKQTNEVYYSISPQNSLSIMPFSASTNTSNSVLQLITSSTFVANFKKAEDKDLIRQRFVRDSPDNLTPESNPVVAEYRISEKKN